MSLSREQMVSRVPRALLGSLIAGVILVPFMIGILNASNASAAYGSGAAEAESVSRGTACLLARQPNAPAHLVAVTYGIQNLILGGKLQSAAAKSIVQYRIGWAVVYRSGNVEVTSGPPINVPAGIAPGRIEEVPAQGGSVTVLQNKGAREILVFVRDLEFATGGRWQADIRSVKSEAQREDVAQAAYAAGKNDTQSSKRAEPRKAITCVDASVDYPEGTVIQEGDGVEQMCVRVMVPRDPRNPDAGLEYIPSWVVTSDAARQRSATIVHLPELPPFYCTPAPPTGGGLCTCEEGAGPFSPGARVNSAKGAYELRCDHGKWAQTSIPNRKK